MAPTTAVSLPPPVPKPPRVSRTVVVQDDPRFPELHCTTIQVAQGTLYSTWFGGSKEGADDVRIWFSKKRVGGDGSWSEPREIAGRPGVVHWNPVCFVPDPTNAPGHVVVFYKTGTPIPIWKTYMVESDDGGESWREPRELVAGDESGGRGPQKNPPIVMANGDWLAGASKEVTLSGGIGHWDAFADVATVTPAAAAGVMLPTAMGSWAHARRTWHRAPFVTLPADRGLDTGSFPGEGVIQPGVWESAPGVVHMFMRSSNGRLQRSDSIDYGRTWTPAYDSGLPSNNSGMSVARVRDGRVVCAYNPVPVNWGPRTPLVLSVSDDNGATWRLWTVLEDKPVDPDFQRVVALETGIVNDGRSEFSYPTVTPTEDGDPEIGVWVSYTWQRRAVVVVKVTDA